MISLFFFMVMGMSLCSSLNHPTELSEEVRADGRFVKFIEAENYPALGSETINGNQSPERSNTTGQLVRTKRSVNPFNPAVAGQGLDALDAGLTILDVILKLPGKCCPNVVISGQWCVDGSKGTPYCAYGGCNIQGCNCDGGCRIPPDDSSVAVVYENRNYNMGLCCSGADKAFAVNSNTCINFGFYNDKITGIVPVHGCVRVWEHGDCGGASMCVCKPIERLGLREMRPGTSWDDQITSMSKC